jgi:hypothetical protein
VRPIYKNKGGINKCIRRKKLIHVLNSYKGIVKTLAGKVGKFMAQEVPSIELADWEFLQVKIDVYK